MFTSVTLAIGGTVLDSHGDRKHAVNNLDEKLGILEHRLDGFVIDINRTQAVIRSREIDTS
jgi:hypothetical protein